MCIICIFSQPFIITENFQAENFVWSNFSTENTTLNFLPGLKAETNKAKAKAKGKAKAKSKMKKQPTETAPESVFGSLQAKQEAYDSELDSDFKEGAESENDDDDDDTEETADSAPNVD